MKGLIFRNFLDMVENEYGYETVDSIIEDSQIKSKGVYTSVGTYDSNELFLLLGELSRKKQIPVFQLLYSFGKLVFHTFLKSYPEYFPSQTSLFELLSEVENNIHVEVLKLYPEAELPKFEVDIINKSEMTMMYYSKRRMADFAEGLIVATIEHFNELARVEKQYIEQDGSVVLFRITKQNEQRN